MLVNDAHQELRPPPLVLPSCAGASGSDQSCMPSHCLVQAWLNMQMETSRQARPRLLQALSEVDVKAVPPGMPSSSSCAAAPQLDRQGLLEEQPGASSGEPTSAAALDAALPSAGSMQGSACTQWPGFEEDLMYTNFTTWRRMQQRRKIVASLWQVYMLYRYRWRGVSWRKEPLPDEVFCCIASYFDPDIHSQRYVMPIDSPLATLRLLLLRAMTDCCR
mmetsp:Transcript_17270/g.30757  ORF Transcript_17270/g.30757 Transcript_17270/m.30757 type:complete len:219 (+) Transcript_17270:44-700(+)